MASRDNCRIIGLIAARADGGQWLAVSGLKDYATEVSDSQRTVTHGDSGGPVLDTQGRLVGVIKGGAGIADQADVEEAVNRDFVGVPPDEDGRLEYLALQPLNAHVIGTLAHARSIDCR